MQYQITTANNQLMPATFQGRWTEKVIQGQRVMYSTNLGAEVDFRVTDASFVRVTMLALAVDLPSWIAIQIDGLPYQRQAVTAEPLTITLDGRPHVLRLVYSGNTDLDPVWTGNAGWAVQALTTDGEVVPVLLGQRSVTFIGDSITAGCWVAGQQPGEDYRAEANYAAVASDQLNARNVRIAYSAAGLNKPGTGGVPPLPATLTAIDATTSWTPVPTDLVVVNVGTNDGRETGARFTVIFRDFLDLVQTTYPNSRIAVMVPFSQRFDRVIRAVTNSFMRIDLIETADWQPALTDQVHLNLTGSLTAGHQLATALTAQYPELFDQDLKN